MSPRPMTSQRLIRCYSAYFRGWAQAFGVHELLGDAAHDLRWLLGEQQLGLILTPAIQPLLASLLHEPADGPDTAHVQQRSQHPGQDTGQGHGQHDRHRSEARLEVRLDAQALVIGTLTAPIAPAHQHLLQRARALLYDRRDLHLYQTYHLVYPSGTRILTLSQRPPLGLIYRELQPLRCTLIADEP
ncbi:hypothetical protein F2Q65_08730 [Thiohalocapsa marina]|uniref:Uncharacterized protein n=1 Tax=Thiohalocapsa marina TaxID=424902 RepID=A0A5M8FRE0_9GAMM|nr:hypothetical protein [Thiohalocapsa marina]KAA6185355.1 hypothetical protein F2Q65_08730 [Thiohalocapsa marina]